MFKLTPMLSAHLWSDPVGARRRRAKALRPPFKLFLGRTIIKCRNPLTSKHKNISSAVELVSLVVNLLPLLRSVAFL